MAMTMAMAIAMAVAMGYGHGPWAMGYGHGLGHCHGNWLWPIAMGHWPWAMGNGPQPKSVAMVAMTRSATNLTWPRYASNAVVLDSLSSATSFNACRGQSR